MRLDDVAAQATAQALDGMLAELEALPESPARALGIDVVDAVIQLYGEGLARLLDAHRAGSLSDDAMRRDDVVSHLLAVHGLLPRAPQGSDLVQLSRRVGSDEQIVSANPIGEEHARCALCAASIDGDHHHMLDVEQHQLVCACDACSILFDERNAGMARYRRIPRRYRSLDRALLDGGLWDRLELPVDVAFMFHSSTAGRPVAFYPGPMGTTESALPLPAWEEVIARSPVLSTLERDVEAVLVRRTRGARDYWIVPVDECYRLAGTMRVTWEGISGGDTMRRAVDVFFRRLAMRERPDRREPELETIHGGQRESRQAAG